jgi:hypothetical protein
LGGNGDLGELLKGTAEAMDHRTHCTRYTLYKMHTYPNRKPGLRLGSRLGWPSRLAIQQIQGVFLTGTRMTGLGRKEEKTSESSLKASVQSKADRLIRRTIENPACRTEVVARRPFPRCSKLVEELTAKER